MGIKETIGMTMMMTGIAYWFLHVIGCIHVINEGHIGIYMRGGAILNTMTEPGINFMAPLITQKYEVQVTIQTDKVTNIPCGTSGGVTITFDQIEVVNRLKKEHAFETIKKYSIDYDKTWIFDKIHHEINQFCSKNSLHEVYISKFDQLDEYLENEIQKNCDQHAPGIEIISVRVTKPKIPQYIQEKFENMEAEKIRLQIAKERQILTEKQQETQRMIQKIRAETEQKLSSVNNQINLIYKQTQQEIQDIKNKVEKMKYDGINQAITYRNEKTQEIDNLRLNKKFIISQLFQQLKAVKKTFYGKDINEYLESNLKVLKSQLLAGL